MRFVPSAAAVRRTALPFGVAAALLFTAGCDTVADTLGLDTITLPLGSVAQNVPVVSGITVAGETTFSRPGGALPDVFDVAGISIDPADLTYQPGSTALAQTGTVEAAFVVAGYVAGMTTATIENGRITAVAPTMMAVGTADRDRYAAMAASAQPSPPTMAPDWRTASATDVQRTVGAAIRNPTFSFALVARTTGTLQGTLSLSKITLGLSF